MGKSKQYGNLIRDAIRLLEDDPGLRAYDINVGVKDGLIHLMGVVDTLSEKRRAEELAGRVPGSRGVENGLTISTDGAVTDDDIAFEVAEELEADLRVNEREVSAQVKDGTVILRGKVDAAAVEAAAIDAATKARGVKEVVSQLEVGDDTIDDATLTNRVAAALAGIPQLRTQSVQARARRGLVRLSGAVSDPQLVQTAESVAAGVSGVRRVKNELKVEKPVKL